MTPTRVRTLAGLAIASTVLLTGCGATPAFSPGAAARIGDETISRGDVDAVAQDYCDAAKGQLQEGQLLAQHYLRGQVAGSLVLRAAADQFAAEHDVSASEDYQQAVEQAEQSLSSMPEEQRQALIDVQGASIYVTAVEKSAGEAILSEQGSGSTSAAAAQKAGQKAFLAWLDDQDLRIDPRFGIDISDGKVTPTDTSLSFPLGDTAKTGDASQPDTDYAAGLPETQRCG